MKFLNCCEDKSSNNVIFNSNSPANMAIIVKITKDRKWQESVSSVLSKLVGVHKFELDAEQATVKISGNLQPDMLMKVIKKSTKKAEITKVYMMKDGVTDDIFTPIEEQAEEEPPSCTCPNCAVQQNQCCNNNFHCYGHYKCLPPPPLSHCQPGGNDCGITYCPGYPLPPYTQCYEPGWPQPLHVYESESSGCSIM